MRNSLGYFTWDHTSTSFRENRITLLLLWISAGAQPQRAFACCQLPARGTPCKSHLPGKQLHPCSTCKHSQGRWGWGELRSCPAALVQPTQQWPCTFSDRLLFGNSSPLKLCAQMPAFTRTLYMWLASSSPARQLWMICPHLYPFLRSLIKHATSMSQPLTDPTKKPQALNPELQCSLLHWQPPQGPTCNSEQTPNFID